MTKSEVMEKIKEILNDLFDDDFDVTESTVADDIDGWDSLAHLQVISAMESGFNIHFTLGEIMVKFNHYSAFFIKFNFII